MKSVVENIAYSRRSPAEALVARFSFAECQVGQSFFIANGDGERATPIPAVAASKLLGRKFIVRDEVNGEGVEGRRVYCVSAEVTEATEAEVTAE